MARRTAMVALTMLMLAGKLAGTVEIPGGGRVWQSYRVSVAGSVRADGPGK